MTAAKMDVASNDDSLTEIGKYFAILIFADSYNEYVRNKHNAKYEPYLNNKMSSLHRGMASKRLTRIPFVL